LFAFYFFIVADVRAASAAFLFMPYSFYYLCTVKYCVCAWQINQSFIHPFTDECSKPFGSILRKNELKWKT